MTPHCLSEQLLLTNLSSQHFCSFFSSKVPGGLCLTPESTSPPSLPPPQTSLEWNVLLIALHPLAHHPKKEINFEVSGNSEMSWLLCGSDLWMLTDLYYYQRTHWARTKAFKGHSEISCSKLFMNQQTRDFFSLFLDQFGLNFSYLFSLSLLLKCDTLIALTMRKRLLESDLCTSEELHKCCRRCTPPVGLYLYEDTSTFFLFILILLLQILFCQL